jgi:hypothetical protein
MALIKILFKHLPGGPEENHQVFGRIAGVTAEILTVRNNNLWVLSVNGFEAIDVQPV